MPLTNFPHGITSFGIPVLGGSDIPFTGKYYFVDPVNGSDGNSGTSPSTALETLSAAHAKCTAGKNDVVYLIGNGQSTGSARESATLAWSKDATHLIGITAPTEVFKRARIAAATDAEFTPLVNVTGDGCLFANVSAFHGYDDASAQICWVDTGERNSYNNVHFIGMGHQTAADQTGGRSLKVGSAGKGEHTFVRCAFGTDTVTRGAANATLEIAGASPRNTFRECTFMAMADAATPVHITVGAGGLDRWALFQDCAFINAVSSTSTTLTGAFSINAAPGGLLLLQRCTSVGATDWEGTASGDVFVDGGAPTATTTGLALAFTV